MRLIKMFGLAAVAAVVAMAFMGGTSATAGTQLCNSHSALACASPAISVSLENEGVGTLLSSLANILCLKISVEATPLGAASPEPVDVSSLLFENCGTGSSHNNCEIEVTELPTVNLSKTGLDVGSVTNTNGATLVACENVDIFGTDIECEYDGTGLEFSAGAQHLTASEVPIEEIGGEFLCPNEPTIDGLLETTENRFILEAGDEAALCKAHTKATCDQNDLVTEVHFVAKNQGWEFEKGNHKVQCEESLLKGSVGKLASPQEITVSDLDWKNCKRNGTENCTVTTKDKGKWGIYFVDLNEGVVALKSSIEITCGAIIKCKVTPNPWKINGAGGGHKGKITVLVQGVIKKEGTCPEPIVWTLEYESLDNVYVLE